MASFGRIAVVFAVCISFSAAEQIRAIVAVHGSVVSGNVTFMQDASGGPVTLTGVIQGLSPGYHGMHVHEKGDLSGGCGSSGGHFNPGMVNHGGPSASVRHVGDLGNIKANSQGTATVTLVDSVISLQSSSPHNIVGRTLVIHAGEDDYGLGGYSDSLTTGHAGARVACGIIGIMSGDVNPMCASTFCRNLNLQDYTYDKDEWLCSCTRAPNPSTSSEQLYQPVPYGPVHYQPVQYQPIHYQPVNYQQAQSQVYYQPQQQPYY